MNNENSVRDRGVGRGVSVRGRGVSVREKGVNVRGGRGTSNTRRDLTVANGSGVGARGRSALTEMGTSARGRTAAIMGRRGSKTRKRRVMQVTSAITSNSLRKKAPRPRLTILAKPPTRTMTRMLQRRSISSTLNFLSQGSVANKP